MTDFTDPKDTLLSYLQSGRDALLWKLDGLSDYDARRPLTATGTNVLGVVKHVASVEAGYLGDCFRRPSPEQLPWFAPNAAPNADMWATAEESMDDIVSLYRRVWQHSDATVAALDLDAPGEVAWWSPQSRNVTLQRILVHVATETHRHAGQVDIVRELMDGSAGLRAGHSNLPDEDEAWWTSYRTRLQEVAESFR